jgi:hypothetical protein
VDWPAAQRFVAELEPSARRDLLRVLTSSSEVRADVIRQFHELGNENMVELLVLLEEREWTRQAMIEEIEREAVKNAEMTMINALHEAWHAAAAIEKGQKLGSNDLGPPHPRTSWGTKEQPIDEITHAVILLVPNIAMPDWPSEIDQGELDELDPEAVERARPEALHLVDDVINRSGVAAVAKAVVSMGWCPGDSATRRYEGAKRRLSPGPQP